MPYKPQRFHQEQPDIAPSPASADTELEVTVAADLALAGGLDAVDVTVTVVNGQLVLAGSVASEADRVRAEEIARRRAAHLVVDNRIRVASGRG